MRHGATEAGVPARGHPPCAPRLPIAVPFPSPWGALQAHLRQTGARAAYPGDDGGVPGVRSEQQRRQQQKEQQRGAARVPHGALGTGGSWGALGARGRARSLAGGPASLRAVIKASAAVTQPAPARQPAGTPRAHPALAHTRAHRPAPETTRAGTPRPASGATQAAPRGAPRPAAVSAGDSRRPFARAQSLFWAETHPAAVLVSKATRAQRPVLAARLFYRCLGSAYYVPGPVDISRGRGTGTSVHVFSGSAKRALRTRYCPSLSSWSSYRKS